MDRTGRVGRSSTPSALAGLAEVWIPVGLPGYRRRRQGPLAVDPSTSGSVADGWRMAHVVRGAVVPRSVAIVEYEAAYGALPAGPARARRVPGDGLRQRLRRQRHERPRRRLRPAAHGDEPLPGHLGPPRHRRAGRRSGLADGHRHGRSATTDLIDLGTGETHRLPRARGFRGDRLLQIRDPLSPGLLPQPRGRAGPRPGAHHVAPEPARTGTTPRAAATCRSRRSGR